MANLFSDNFNLDANGNWVPGLVSARLTHSKMHKKRMRRLTGVTAVNDTIVMGTFRSSDRLYDLQGSSSTGAPSTGAFNLGLYVSALDDRVPVAANIIDVDLFASGVSVTSQLNRSDLLLESGTINAWQRGLTLWEMAALGAGAYTEDPMEDWDLVLTSTANINVPTVLMFEADMVSFG